MHRSLEPLAGGILVLAMVAFPAWGAEPFVADADPDRPNLHLQPPALVPARGEATNAVSGVINGIFFIDVLAAAGFDVGGSDYGNEPAITASPLDPNRIVLTSFSGSDWFSGGNSSLFYSGDAGATWTYSVSIPPPPGVTSAGCPCDQTLDWARDGYLYGTFLNFHTDGVTSAVYSAQAQNPTDPASWSYRTTAGIAQTTSLPSYANPDQPWLFSGPLPGDTAVTNVCVAYDKFDSTYTLSETRVADSPGETPLDFTRDAPSNVDGDAYNDGMNLGTRIAVGPDGKIWNVFQRLDGVESNGVKRVTYLISVSTDGGQTWSVANSDHVSGAKILASNVYTFQGNGSKVGGVNALLGGSDAISVDPRTGVAWIVYGLRPTLTGVDQLFLVPVTYDAGDLNVGTPHLVSPSAGARFYMPAVAVLPSGEVGVLFMGFATNFTWRFVQTTDGGITLAKNTTLATFTSPFAPSSATNQRILGDYVQVRAVGCSFYGTYPARGTGANSASSIDPYFMRAPAAAACGIPTLTGLAPSAVCAGSPGTDLALTGTGFFPGATGLIQGALRSTQYDASTQVTVSALAADLAVPGSRTIDLLGSAPAGGRTGSLPLLVETPAASPGSSLRVSKAGGNVQLDWAASAGASSYGVRRCTAAPRPCTPASIGTSGAPAFQDPSLQDGLDSWYLIDSVNSCGAVP